MVTDRKQGIGASDEEQQLDNVLGRRVSGLDNENILPSNIFVDLDEDLTVREPPDRDPTERLTQLGGDLLGQETVRRPRHEEHFRARNRDFRHNNRTSYLVGVTKPSGSIENGEVSPAS